MGAKPTKRLSPGRPFESPGELFKNMTLCPLSRSLKSESLWQGRGVATFTELFPDGRSPAKVEDD